MSRAVRSGAGRQVALSLLCLVRCADDACPYPAPPPAEGLTVATVGETDLDQGWFRAQAKLEGVTAVQRTQTREGLTAFVGEMADRELMAQEAWARGYATAPAVQAALKRALVEHLLRETLPPPSDQEFSEPALRAAYETRRDQYQTPARVRLRRLHLPVDSDRARARLAEIEAKLKAGDAPRAGFEAMVRRYSPSPKERDSGGDLGYLTRPAVAKRWGEAAAQKLFEHLAVGAVAQFPEGGGRSLLQKVGFRRGRLRDYQSVRSELHRTLQREAQQARYEALITSLRSKHRFKIYPDRIEAPGATD